MSTKQPLPSPASAADAFGRAVAARLSAGADELGYEQRERLRAARARALAARRQAAAQAAPVRSGHVGRDGTATLGERDRPSLFTRIGSVLPLLVLAAGLVLLHGLQADRRASELAAVDVALLTDDLPPAAYADPGFLQFLNQSGPDSPKRP